MEYRFNIKTKVFVGAAVAEWLSSWLAEQEDRGSIPGLATWIFRDWLSPASKSRYGWKITKSMLSLKTTNQLRSLLALRFAVAFCCKMKQFPRHSCIVLQQYSLECMWCQQKQSGTDRHTDGGTDRQKMGKVFPMWCFAGATKILLNLCVNAKTFIYHFQVFVANPNKPKPILDILLRNKEKLVDFLTKFHTDRSDDEQFNDEKAYLIKQIKELKSQDEAS